MKKFLPAAFAALYGFCMFKCATYNSNEVTDKEIVKKAEQMMCKLLPLTEVGAVDWAVAEFDQLWIFGGKSVYLFGSDIDISMNRYGAKITISSEGDDPVVKVDNRCTTELYQLIIESKEKTEEEETKKAIDGFMNNPLMGP
jgi:hypothetical protein